MNKIETILDQLETLTLLEASELVEKIEKTFGVDASTNTGMMMMASTPVEGAQNEIEEKTEFDLILSDVPADKKIAILKVVRTITGVGLKEAKDLVESAPKTIQENMAKDAAEHAKKQLEDAGGKADLK